MATLRVPELVPSPTQDSERLHKAFEGWGADEQGIIWVLGHRNASQRRKIRDTYQELYGESLIDRLQSELSGDFKNAVILWTYDPPERDAKLAREALKSKKGINQLHVIVEIACTTSPGHLIAVRQTYCSLFDCSLEEDIATNVPPPLNKILIGLVSSFRYNKHVLDSNLASLDAAKLQEAIEMKKLDMDDVVWILGTRNFFQLRTTFDCYNLTCGNSLDQDLQNAGNGDVPYLLRVVIGCIDSPEKYFAQVIRVAIEGLGTDEHSLNRAIVSRAEIDMMKIKSYYLEVNKTSIDNAVIGDTSGYFFQRKKLH